MLSSFLIVLEQMLRIFLYFVVGFALNRLNVLPKGSGVGISRVVTNVLLPALLLHTNMTEFNIADIGSYGMLVLSGGLLWVTFALLSMPIAKGLSKGNSLNRGIYLYSLSFPNAGGVAMPLIQAIMGSVGVFYYNLFMLPATIMTYAWGVELFLDVERKKSFKRFLTHLCNPIFISLAAGLLLGALGAKNWMPSLVTNFTGDLSSCYVPFSLLLIGYMIAEHPIKNAFKYPKSYFVITLRLIVFPLLALGAVWLFRCSEVVAVLALLVVASPCGMNVVLFPAAYKQDCSVGVSLVLPSSLAAVLTVPVMYALLQLIIG